MILASSGLPVSPGPAGDGHSEAQRWPVTQAQASRGLSDNVTVAKLPGQCLREPKRDRGTSASLAPGAVAHWHGHGRLGRSVRLSDSDRDS
jgi:hypothetical protein